MNKQANPMPVRTFIHYSLDTNRPLAVTGIASIVLLGFSMTMMMLDPRTVLNESVWLKPSKFAVSIAFYVFTFLWLIQFVEGKRLLKGILTWITVIAFAGELTIIILQAARGVRSHFNFSTAFDGFLFSTMGTLILVLWAASLVAALLLIRQRLPDRAYGLSLKLGLFITVIGSGLGALMTRPTPAQLDAMASSGTPAQFIGAHSVGVEDGGAGLPVTGWSTTGGDLRIGHFVGLHAMQVLPLLGWFITRQNRRLSVRRRRGLVWTAGAGYLAVVLALTGQALRGQPLLQPDALTLAVWGGIILLSLLSAGWFLRPDHRRVTHRLSNSTSIEKFTA